MPEGREGAVAATVSGPRATDDFETVTPLSYRTEGAVRPVSEVPPTRVGRSSGRRWIVPLIALLLAISLAVFLYLPEWVQTRHGHSPTRAPQPLGAPQVSVPAADSRSISEQTRRLLVDAISSEESLRSRGAEEWAGPDFIKSVDLRLQAENALQSSDEALADALLNESLAGFAALTGQLPERLTAALASAELALVSGEQQRSLDEFRLALSMDPTNTVATKGLRRAEHLEEVLALMQTGADAERAGQFERGSEAYRKALRIDELWEPAAVAVARVEAEGREETYRGQMSRAVDAVARGDLSEAHAAYRAASAAHPDSADARAGLAYVQEALRSEQIQTHREKALQAERLEDWEQAVLHYRAMLDLDLDLAVAGSGLASSQERLRLSNRMRDWIDHPTALYDPKTLLEAESVVTATKLLARGPRRFDADMARLAALVVEASTPIRVVLESDGRTEVSVQRTGSLGVFERRELQLRPGTYIVRGIRRGYRDVRRVITLAPDTGPRRIEVRCSEEI